MNKKKILIVDDDLQFSSLLQLNLSQHEEFEVSTETDSTKAIAAIRDLKPDLILLDIVMPDLDGGDIQRLLLADPELRDIRIIVISAIVDTPQGDEGWVMSGGNLMLPKTAPPDVMYKCIQLRLAGEFDAQLQANGANI